jgi:hypothetical protein
MLNAYWFLKPGNTAGNRFRVSPKNLMFKTAKGGRQTSVRDICARPPGNRFVQLTPKMRRSQLFAPERRTVL